ncbi:uncharacterized protein MONBRDRAFT_31936 [Monosiga brevicollis MX1]|uniref:Uncharacterized protein n=1 Tax=Monosiga brevicollis TaxID=81824 RepID=A9UWD2_MONBE|nr:uncharacterized protein MONBRDRAFT_31936 [Monosiga brevicollis MX1]EDQ90542.1 predicted protein [Monosiga brevicollis MX1]|eukprot:XP_001744593.1 hypothetical protein [Monosiga brevicollis MX1]
MLGDTAPRWDIPVPSGYSFASVDLEAIKSRMTSLLDQELYESASILGESVRLHLHGLHVYRPAASLDPLLARAYRRQGDVKRAKIVLNSALQHCTGTEEPMLWNELLECHLQLHDHESANKLLLQVNLDLIPPSILIRVARFVQVRDRHHAIRLLKKALAQEPYALEAQAMLLKLQTDVREAELTTKACRYDKALYWWPAAAAAHACEGLGDVLEAVKHVELGLQVAPHSTYLLGLLGSLRYMHGNMAASIMAFDKAWEGDNHLARRFMPTYAILLQTCGRQNELQALAGAMMDANPQQPEAWQVAAEYMSLMCNSQEDIALCTDYADKGKAFVQRALELDPLCHEAQVTAGFLYIRLGQMDDARFTFRKSLALGSTFRAHQGLTRSMLGLKRYREAIQTVLPLPAKAKTTKNNGNVGESDTCLCLMAVQVAKDYAEKMKKSPRALALLGHVCNNFSDGSARARRAFTQALALDAHCIDAIFGMCEVYAREKQFQMGIDLLERHASYFRTDTIYNRLGNLYMDNNDPATALEYFKISRTLTLQTTVVDRLIASAQHRLNGTSEEE